jgi:hypothetical protein
MGFSFGVWEMKLWLNVPQKPPAVNPLGVLRFSGMLQPYAKAEEKKV